MRSVTHREMRNHSAELLRSVEAGESVIVTNNGRVAAVIGPAGRSVLDGLVENGQARVALRDIGSLRVVNRATSELTSDEILTDIRGRW